LFDEVKLLLIFGRVTFLKSAKPLFKWDIKKINNQTILEQIIEHGEKNTNKKQNVRISNLF
jgi:hypothetical protein